MDRRKSGCVNSHRSMASSDGDYFSTLDEQRHAVESGALPADVQHEIARLMRADLVILQFPLWWHAQPAMLKGWFDRVFAYGGPSHRWRLSRP